MDILDFVNKNHTICEFNRRGLHIIKGNNADGKRIIVYKQKNGNVLTELESQSTGAVFCYNENDNKYEQLVIPPAAFLTGVDKSEIDNNINDYEAFYATDGTLVNLYYWQGQWRFSTGRGFDVTNYNINKNKTIGEYKKVFDGILDKMLNAAAAKEIKDVADFYDGLDKKRCYTFIISLHNLNVHILTDEEKIIFVQSIDLSSVSSAPPSEIQVSFECPYNFMPAQYSADNKVSFQKLGDLLSINKNSIREFAGNHYKNHYKNYCNRGKNYKKKHVGFIIKNIKNTNNGRNIMLSSILFRTIENNFYNFGAEPRAYQVLRLYINNRHDRLSESMIRKLGFGEYLDVIKTKINLICQNIMNIYMHGKYTDAHISADMERICADCVRNIMHMPSIERQRELPELIMQRIECHNNFDCLKRYVFGVLPAPDK